MGFFAVGWGMPDAGWKKMCLMMGWLAKVNLGQIKFII